MESAVKNMRVGTQYAINRGHPLAGQCQASKRTHGGASRQF
jgi:hypothetical protein